MVEFNNGVDLDGKIAEAFSDLANPDLRNVESLKGRVIEALLPLNDAELGIAVGIGIEEHGLTALEIREWVVGRTDVAAKPNFPGDESQKTAFVARLEVLESNTMIYPVGSQRAA